MKKKPKIKIPSFKNGGMQNWTQEDIDKYNSLPTEELKKQFAENMVLAPTIQADSNIKIPDVLTTPKDKRLNSVLRNSAITDDTIASAVKGASIGMAANASNEKPVMQQDQTIVPTDMLGSQKLATKAIGVVAGEETGKNANAFAAGSSDAMLKSVASGNLDPVSLAIAGMVGGISNIKKRKNYNKQIDQDITNQTNALNETLSENARIGATTGAYDKNYVPAITQSDINKEKNRIKNMKVQKLASGGEVQGPGTAKSDSIKTKLEPGSFVVPVENTPLAKSLRKRFLGGSGKILKAKDGASGVPVKLSKGEHIFTPEEKKALQAKGVNVKALAPNADSSMNYDDGGDVKSKVEDLYKNRNVRAYLRFVAYAESRWKKNADNPKSTAFGEFQFIDSTHKAIKNKYGYDARSTDPIEREKAAIALIIDNGADKLVQDRNSWTAADKKLNGIWTSLPGGKEPQSGVTDKANTFRTQYLNDLANTDRDTGKITPIVPGNKATVVAPVKSTQKAIIAPRTPKVVSSSNKYLDAAIYYSRKATEAAQKELTNWSKKFGYGDLKLSDVTIGDFKMPRVKINGKEQPIDPTVSEENKKLILALKRHNNGLTAVSEISGMNGKSGGALLDPKHYSKTVYEKYIGPESTIDKIPNKSQPAKPTNSKTSEEVSDYYQSITNVSANNSGEATASGASAAGKLASASDVAQKIVAGKKLPTTKPAATTINSTQQKTKELVPPPSTPEAQKTAFEKLQDSGITDTVFSAVQFAQGMNLVNRSKRPKDTVPLELRVRLADAVGDEARAQQEAMSGLDPVTKQAALDNMELAKRTDFAEIDQSTGKSPMADLLKRVSANNKYRAIVQLSAADEQARLEKKGIAAEHSNRADNLSGAVSNYKRTLFEDDNAAFHEAQKAGAELINAGMANYFQGLATRRERKRDEELLKKYGITI